MIAQLGAGQSVHCPAGTVAACANAPAGAKRVPTHRRVQKVAPHDRPLNPDLRAGALPPPGRAGLATPGPACEESYPGIRLQHGWCPARTARENKGFQVIIRGSTLTSEMMNHDAMRTMMTRRMTADRITAPNARPVETW